MVPCLKSVSVQARARWRALRVLARFGDLPCLAPEVTGAGQVRWSDGQRGMEIVRDWQSRQASALGDPREGRRL